VVGAGWIGLESPGQREFPGFWVKDRACRPERQHLGRQRRHPGAGLLGLAGRHSEAEPRGWIAQELVLLSTSPAQLGDQLLPRHVDLRPFAVNDGAQVRVLPGGLTRVALREGSLIVNSSQGGGSKDTWVLTSSPGWDAEADGVSALPPQAVRGAEPDRGPHQDQQQ
jgi:hypothetical protein